MPLYTAAPQPSTTTGTSSYELPFTTVSALERNRLEYLEGVNFAGLRQVLEFRFHEPIVWFVRE